MISTDYASILPPSKRVEGFYMVGLGVREPYDGAIPLGASTFYVGPQPMGENTQFPARQIVTSRDLEHALHKHTEMVAGATSRRETGLRNRGVDPSAIGSDEFVAGLGLYAYGVAQAGLAAIKSAETAVATSGSRLDTLLSRSEGLLDDTTATHAAGEGLASAMATVYVSRLKELKARQAHEEHMAIVRSYREVSALRDLASKYLAKGIAEQHRSREFWTEEIESTAEWLEYGAQQYLCTAKAISEEVRERTEGARRVYKGRASRQKLDELESRTIDELKSELEAFCLVTEVGRAQEAERLKAAATTRASHRCGKSHFDVVDDDDDEEDDADGKDALQHPRESPGTAGEDAIRRAEGLQTIWIPSPSETFSNSGSGPEWVTVLRKSTSPRSRSGMVMSRPPAWGQESNEPRHARLYRDLKIGWNRFTSRAPLPDPHFPPVPLLRGSSRLGYLHVPRHTDLESEALAAAMGGRRGGEAGAHPSYGEENSRWFWARLRGEEWTIASLLGKSRPLPQLDPTFDSVSDPGADLREDQRSEMDGRGSTDATIHAQFDWGDRTVRRVSSFADLPTKDSS
jgi:hypothetical protein